MIIRVNNDVTLGLTTGGLPISVRSNRHQQRDPSLLYTTLCNRPAAHHALNDIACAYLAVSRMYSPLGQLPTKTFTQGQLPVGLNTPSS